MGDAYSENQAWCDEHDAAEAERPKTRRIRVPYGKYHDPALPVVKVLHQTANELGVVCEVDTKAD